MRRWQRAIGIHTAIMLLPVFRINSEPAPVPFVRLQPHTDCSRRRAPISAVATAKTPSGRVSAFGMGATESLSDGKELCLLISWKRLFESQV